MRNPFKIIKKVRRYRQIINILLKYGFEVIVDKFHIFKFPLRRKKKFEYRFPIRVRKILEELGPTFIKLGQILSTRPDLIPMEYIKELEKLQDEVKEENFYEMKSVFEKEIGEKIENIFNEFEVKPIATGSLSCVYMGNYKGEKVAVKIQRPGVKEKILMDIEILYDIANLFEKFIKESEIYQPQKIVKEFEKNLKRELNFLIEAKNIQIMKEKFNNYPKIFIPKVYKELCTEKVLVTQFIEGIKINKVEEWSKFVDKEIIIKNGIEIILKQIFDFGFFHGDPHPGNIFVLKDGRIGFVDFGIVGRVDDEKKYYLLNMIEGIIKGKTDRIISTLKLMGNINSNVDIEELREDIEDVIEVYRNMPLKNLKFGELLSDIFDVMRRNRIRIPANLSLMGKTVVTLEGICSMIDPEFKFVDYIEPIMFELMEKKLKISYIRNEIYKMREKVQYILKEMPESLELVIKNFMKKSNPNIANKDIIELRSSIEKVGLEISYTILFSFFIISAIFFSFLGHILIGITLFLVSLIIILLFFRISRMKK